MQICIEMAVWSLHTAAAVMAMQLLAGSSESRPHMLKRPCGADVCQGSQEPPEDS